MKKLRLTGLHDSPKFTRQVREGAGSWLRTARLHHLTMRYKDITGVALLDGHPHRQTWQGKCSHSSPETNTIWSSLHQQRQHSTWERCLAVVSVHQPPLLELPVSLPYRSQDLVGNSINRARRWRRIQMQSRHVSPGRREIICKVWKPPQRESDSMAILQTIDFTEFQPSSV